jgi:hypothetical protein
MATGAVNSVLRQVPRMALAGEEGRSDGSLPATVY